MASDETHPVQTAEVAEDKGVARLRLVRCALSQAEMPDGVLLPRVRLQKRVLLPRARLRGLPARSEHVLARVDQLLRVPDRIVVHRVGGHARIHTKRISGVKRAAELVCDVSSLSAIFPNAEWFACRESAGRC